jgi:hypothetical protein
MRIRHVITTIFAGTKFASDDARAKAYTVFAVLAADGLVFLAVLASLGLVGYPDIGHGYSQALALAALTVFILASQVTLLTGIFAFAHALYLRHATPLPVVDAQLIERRSKLALAAGAVTMAALLLYIVNFLGVLPVWWLVAAGALIVVILAAMTRVWRALTTKSASKSVVRPNPDHLHGSLLLRTIRQYPAYLAVTGVLTGVVAITLVGWHAERSLVEGVERGVIEGLALAIAFFLLARTSRANPHS